MLLCLVYLLDDKLSTGVSLWLLRSPVGLGVKFGCLCEGNLGLADGSLLRILRGAGVGTYLHCGAVLCLGSILACGLTLCAICVEFLLKLRVNLISVRLADSSWSLKLDLWPTRIRIQGDFSASLMIFLARAPLLLLRSPLGLLLDKALLTLLLLEEIVPSHLHAGRELWRADIVHLLMVNENLRREALQDPDVL